jgi:hypothetical protein
MPWVKVDDAFADHPKVVQAGPLAAWLYVAGLCYCGRLLTDGFIPRGQVRKLADVPGALKLAARLVEVGLWEEYPDGYRVHDYLDYNPSREQVAADRAATRERVAKWRSKPRNASGNGVTNGVGNGVSTDAPARTRPTGREKAPNGSSLEGFRRRSKGAP